MAVVSMHGVSLSYGSDPLLDNIELIIEPGDRACLVGRNGTGKSSLLKILHGDVSPDSGDIRCHPDTRIAYLPQDVPMEMSGLVEEIATSWIQGSPDDSHHTVGRVLSHLSLDPADRFESLSGGQKRRVLLARALACEPDLLLLDEPTNHLDIDSICWMENFLLRHCKTFLFVTHDRAFLRRISNRIIDLDRGKLAHWSCNYDTFLRRKAELMHDEKVQQENFDRKLSKEEAWIRQGIKARRTRDEGRVRELMRMRDERRQRREVEGNARIQLQDAERSGAKVIDCKNITFSYDPGTPIIKEFSAKIMRGDKVGIIGPNGSGKTTLLKLFTNELTPSEGEVVLGTRLETAYFDQHRAVLNDEETVAQNAGRGMDTIMINGHKRHVISYLQDFLFTPDRAKTPVKVLSGGERNRLLLAMLFSRPSNFLIMDEPTNDLDTETLELLEEQLLNYQGTVLMVSHDRAFLNNVVTSIFRMEENGRVKEYVGGYDDCERAVNTAATEAKPGKKKNARQKEKSGKRFGFNENRELKALPRKIEKLETEQTELHDRMASPDYFKTDPEHLAEDRERAQQITTELAALYDRWEELEELKEGS